MEVSDEANLKSEVQAFASGLGLAAAGSRGFHDEDFKPGAGKKAKTGKSSEQQGSKAAVSPLTGKPSKASSNKPVKKAHKDTKEPGKSPERLNDGSMGRSGKAMAASSKQQPHVKERQWNAGVGARPGLCEVTI